MRLGLLTAPFPGTPLMDVADWTAANGFESIEIACWPPDHRPDAGATPGPATSTSRTCRPARRTDIVGEIAAKGLDDLRPRLLPQPAPPGPGAPRRRSSATSATSSPRPRQMDVPFVNTFMGARRREEPGRELGRGARASGPTSSGSPQDHGRKITIENCPMLFSYDEWPGGHNLATTPRIWRRILERWGGTIGLNFDPSHLILQMIDIPRFIREFGPHILHVQAKDLMIDREGLYERGVFSPAWAGRSRACPGLGDVDWARCSPRSTAPATTAT